ncbi:rRNA methyltransferase 3, mitochondrial [Podarcis lilfordi]|uniref:rRNA methyltransferase 3, mitochondrial n=1 Tax=Podarcis lilfordi TaxID=74358 RepID=A0AA35LEB7_9SAUR|nr:rRNA methyltransferase 3, mitochondrial [Podarcis lilfordi]
MAAFMRGARAPFLLLRPALGSAAGRRGVRALKRSPVRVLPSVAETREEQRRVVPGPPQLKAGPSKKPRDQAGWESKAPKAAAAKEEKKVPERKEAELCFERAQSGDKRLSKVVTLAKSRSFRERHGKILLEGRRLITDALAAGAIPQTLFFSAIEHLKELPVDKLKGASLVKVKFEDLKTWSDVITSQGVIGIFSRPDHAKMAYPEVQREHALPLSLICDNIRDPGNMGTLLRSAAGAGCSRVLLLKGCVDAWEPKVLRAGMGAHFRLSILSDLDWGVLPSYLLPDSCIHVADCSQAQAAPAVAENAASHGWVSRPYNLKAKPALQDWDRDLDGSEDERQESGRLEVQPYSEPWMEGPATAVVIGGETHGVSAEARQLAQSTGGKRLVIPVVPGMDSLNCAMAASILLFEGKRQMKLSEAGRNPISGIRQNC